MNETNLKLLKEFLKKRKDVEDFRKTLNERDFKILDGIGNIENHVHLANIYDIVDEDAKINIERYTSYGNIYERISTVVDGITIFHVKPVEEEIDTISEDQ